MRQSQLFTKTLKELPKDEVSINAQYLLRGGYIDKLTAGIYTILPLGLRVLARIEQIIREEMNAIGGQELLLPALHPKEIWEATGRWSDLDVLFRLQGAGEKDYALGATHEEVITPLTQKFLMSYKDFPQYVYQIQTKFRNEARAKSGILRGREFRMKDLYSFHTSQEDLDAYYERVQDAYNKIYERCGLGEQTYLTYASGGTFSKYSHEYQTLTDAGEDMVSVCASCHIAINEEIIDDLKHACPQCGNDSLETQKAIEVGNIFKLGTKYADAFRFTYTDIEGNDKPVIMGCYGIGTTRLLGSVVEVHHDEQGIVWPEAIAPYAVHFISLCVNQEDVKKAEAVYAGLQKQGVDVLYDDRPDIRAGEKFADSDLLGIPKRMVMSPKTIAEGKIEIKKRAEQRITFEPLFV